MRENGETIYKTTGGPITPTDEMVFTQKGNTLYLHILDDSKELFFVENFKGNIRSMHFYKSKEKVNYKISKYGIFIEVPNNKKNQIDTIIEIILK
jgi:alpha-L-fucosidase